jgi:hypothetical protein
LFYGVGFFYYYRLHDEFGNKIVPSLHVEYLTNEALNNKVTFLRPGKTRVNTDWLDTKEFFLKPGRYRMVFYWDGFLDGNTEGELSRFSCEKWIEVTK